MKQTDVYQTALARAKADQRVTNALGTPIEESWYLKGNTEVSGDSGKADITIPISGPKGKGASTLSPPNSPANGRYSKMVVKIESTGETIDLNQ